MHKYRLISKKGEGTFSEVLKAQQIRNGKYVAIKCMKNNFDSVDQVNNLREIQALRRLAGHPNLIKLHEVLYDEPTGRLALVFELMDMNLYEAIKGRRHYLPEQKVKQYMYELMKALDHMHRNGIFHRDVKPENLLLLDDEIKLADLGSCRGIYSRQPYTEYISTRWYRAPECLLTDGFYNFKMDLFAAGCVWFEISALFPLFPGQNEMDQIQKIHNVLGTPDPDLLARKFRRNASHMDFNFPEKKGSGIERLVPHVDPEAVEVIKKLIKYDPDERLLARQVLKDPYFKEFRDAEKERTAGPSSSSAMYQSGLGGSRRTHRQQHPPRESAVAAAGATTCASSSAVVAAEKVASATKEPLSPGPSTPSIEGSRSPEVVHVSSFPENTSASNSSRALPNIRRERRRADGAPTPVAGYSDGEDADDGTLLPPIGGIKARREGHVRQKGSKAVPKEQAMSQSLHSTGSQAHNNSKGFGAGTTGTSLASTGGDGPSSCAGGGGQSWAAAGGDMDPSTTNGSNKSMNAAEKMSSTWSPTHQRGQKYVSPFGHKGPREPSFKKR